MKPDNIFPPRGPRAYVVLDLESAVTDETGHKRYLAMERWAPRKGKPPRRGYTRGEDPCLTPRWPFQTIVTASIMVLTENGEGGINVARFTTLSHRTMMSARLSKASSRC